MSLSNPLQEIISNCLKEIPSRDPIDVEKAKSRNQELTKPLGSLGRLEDLAIWYCSWQGYQKTQIENILVAIFAGNHGVAKRGVSAFPIEVTAQMVTNFHQGGAAINQLTNLLPATLKVIELNLDQPTGDISTKPAMNQKEFHEAFQTGWEAINPSYDLIILGEMGIGNTTSASAIGYALFGGKVEEWVGSGTGISDKSLQFKQKIVEQAVNLFQTQKLDSPLELIRCLGGRELVAIMGSLVKARMNKIPVIIDGFISTAPLAVLHAIDSRLTEHAVAGHLSLEGGHRTFLDKLGLNPILDLKMRLGEGSGAAVAAHILRSAVTCYGGMATFSQAMVSNKP